MVLRLNILRRLWSLGKCLSISLRNLRNIYIYFLIYIISIVVCLVSFSSCLDYFVIFSLLFQFLDIYECKSVISDCDVNANCTNTDGSYKCKCKAGYNGDGHSCSGTYTFIFKDDLIYFASSSCFSSFFC